MNQEKFKSITWSNISAILIIGLLCYLEVFGLYHAFHKHKASDGIFASVLPPWAWYRAVELWWHNDFAGVDWNKRLEYDAQTCIGIIDTVRSLQQGESIRHSGDIGKTIDELSKRIAEYPKDKREYLKTVCKNYIFYNESVLLDLLDFVSGRNPVMVKSMVTSDYENELMSYPFMKGVIEMADKKIFSRFEQMPPEGLQIPSREMNKRADVLVRYMVSSDRKMRAVYRDVFNEELERIGRLNLEQSTRR